MIELVSVMLGDLIVLAPNGAYKECLVYNIYICVLSFRVLLR